MKPGICSFVAFGLVILSMAACDPIRTAPDPAGWTEAQAAKAKTRDQRSQFYRGSRAGAR